MQTVGAEVVFAALTEREQRAYVDTSLEELSAYVCWQREMFQCPGRFSASSSWDLLDNDIKKAWLPGGEFRRVLAEERVFASLLQ